MWCVRICPCFANACGCVAAVAVVSNTTELAFMPTFAAESPVAAKRALSAATNRPVQSPSDSPGGAELACTSDDGLPHSASGVSDTNPVQAIDIPPHTRARKYARPHTHLKSRQHRVSTMMACTQGCAASECAWSRGGASATRHAIRVRRVPWRSSDAAAASIPEALSSKVALRPTTQAIPMSVKVHTPPLTAATDRTEMLALRPTSHRGPANTRHDGRSLLPSKVSCEAQARVGELLLLDADGFVVVACSE